MTHPRTSAARLLLLLFSRQPKLTCGRRGRGWCEYLRCLRRYSLGAGGLVWHPRAEVWRECMSTACGGGAVRSVGANVTLVGRCTRQSHCVVTSRSNCRRVQSDVARTHTPSPVWLRGPSRRQAVAVSRRLGGERYVAALEAVARVGSCCPRYRSLHLGASMRKCQLRVNGPLLL